MKLKLIAHIENPPEWLTDGYHPCVFESNPKYVRKVGKIYYDNQHGLGACGNNMEINFKPIAYEGFCVMMKPWVFLKLAKWLEEPREGRIELLERIMTDPDEPRGIGCPILYVRRPEKEGDLPIVRGHEGRHRMKVIAKLNGESTPTPVQIWTSSHWNEEETKKDLEQLKYGIIEQDGRQNSEYRDLWTVFKPFEELCNL